MHQIDMQRDNKEKEAIKPYILLKRVEKPRAATRFRICHQEWIHTDRIKERIFSMFADWCRKCAKGLVKRG